MKELQKKVEALGLEPGKLSERALVLALDAYDKGQANAPEGAGDGDPLDSLQREEILAQRMAESFEAGRTAGRDEMAAELREEFAALQTEDINEGATVPADFEQAVKAMGYPEARRQFPELFNRYERLRRKRRKAPSIF